MGVLKVRQVSQRKDSRWEPGDKHLGLWDIKRKSSPVANAPPIISDSDYISSVDDYVIDSVYPVQILPSIKTKL